ncbi:hypothetical protein A6770_34530 [Nostoc minutum NIES-26]|uniref:Uncharacterized protein n=1 Tax=Nostoc minutum NIES-26 TaxID=1844469 RepID=A0A367S197_9NOSO|nr:hypothetical protein A6770_34530 [Nostoc minutum NIES-26]
MALLSYELEVSSPYFLIASLTVIPVPMVIVSEVVTVQGIVNSLVAIPILIVIPSTVMNILAIVKPTTVIISVSLMIPPMMTIISTMSFVMAVSSMFYFFSISFPIFLI